MAPTWHAHFTLRVSLRLARRPSTTLGNNESNIVPEGAAQDTQSTTPGDTINFTPEGDILHSNLDPEGATHDSSMPLFLKNIANNELSDTGRPCRNVGNYKQGPAKIRRFPIKG